MKRLKGIVLLLALAVFAMSVGKVQAGTTETLQALQLAVTALQTQVADLQYQLDTNDAVQIGKLGYMKFDTSNINNVVGPHVILEGVNVHVRDGSLDTAGNNALGNLIIGYNEYNSETGGGGNAGDREGSHNLIMGRGHIFDALAKSIGIDNYMILFAKYANWGCV